MKRLPLQRPQNHHLQRAGKQISLLAVFHGGDVSPDFPSANVTQGLEQHSIGLAGSQALKFLGLSFFSEMKPSSEQRPALITFAGLPEQSTLPVPPFSDPRSRAVRESGQAWKFVAASESPLFPTSSARILRGH